MSHGAHLGWHVEIVTGYKYVFLKDYLLLGPMTPYTPILGISRNYWGQWGWLELVGANGG